MPLAAEISRHPSKTPSKSIGKTRSPPLKITRQKSTGRPLVLSAGSYEAGKRLGSEATKLLEHVPDDDLRLFGTIELAAAQAGAPAALSIIQMKQPRPMDQPQPRNSPGFQAGRIIASMPVNGESANGPPMRSPDGRLIRCPKCLFQPPADHRWICKCDHVWNTFETAGDCPSCHVNWVGVICPRCGERAGRQRCYAPEV
jgi:hypothetical protein